MNSLPISRERIGECAGSSWFAQGARVYRGGGRVLEDAVVEIRGRKIGRVARIADVGAPGQNRCLIRAEVITPGFIDAHTHLGVWSQGAGLAGHDLNETSEIVSPHVQAADSLDPRDTAFAEAVRSGVTAVAISPGSATLIAGQVCLAKTWTCSSNRIVRNPIGMKAALGAVPLRKYEGKGPTTRMGALAALRETFVSAQNYVALKQRNDGLARNLRFEALNLITRGEIPLHVHAHERHCMTALLRFAEELHIKLVLIHATESAYLAQELARANVPVVLGPVLMSQQSPELKELSAAAAGRLRAAGVQVATTTDHGAVPIWALPICAALYQKAGMTYLDALDSITSTPAEICGVGGRLGVIEEGADADIVAFNGDPLAVSTRVLATIVDGELAYGGEEPAS